MERFSIVVQNQLKEISIIACVDIFTQDFENHLSSKYIKNIEVYYLITIYI